MRFAAKVDDNQAAIVAALRKCGASVQSLAAIGQGCPDLLVGYRGRTAILEIKDGNKVPSKRHLTSLQRYWHASWCGTPVVVVESVEEAIKAVCGDA